MKKSLALLCAIFLGFLIPQAEIFSPIIRYLLMFMLFFPFLEWEISKSVFSEKKVYWILLANIFVGVSSYFLLRYYDPNLALIGLLVGLTPTATACPAVIGFLKGDVSFAVSTVFFTNLVMSLFIPFMIIMTLGIQVEGLFILGQTLLSLGVPLILGQFMRFYIPHTANVFLQWKKLGFYAWILVCFLAVSKATAFIQSSHVSLDQIIIIGSVSAGICVVNFLFGKTLGGETLSLECSQTLGQKNTTLTIWLALTYFTPLIALGPIFYLICHNLYNAYQLATYKVKPMSE